MSTARIKPITTPVILATATALNGEPSGDAGVDCGGGLGGWEYARAACKVLVNATDFAEYRFWTRDKASQIWAPDNRINGNGLFRATEGTDGDAVTETLHIVGADRVYLEQTGRTDADVRSVAFLTLANGPQV